MQLYEIPAALRTPLDALDGEQDIQNDNEILNELQPQEKEQSEEFIKNVALYLLEIQAEQNQIKEQMARLKKRLERETIRYERVEASLLKEMIQSDTKRLKTPLVTVGIRKSEGTEIYSENDLPREFFAEKVTYSPDKAKIKEMLKEGVVIPGARLEERLNINIK